jgi:hypothetical protein
MKNPLGRLQSPQIFFVRIWTPPFIRSAHLRPQKIYASINFYRAQGQNFLQKLSAANNDVTEAGKLGIPPWSRKGVQSTCSRL